ncbi:MULTISPECIES: hypothetical protein [Pseudomonas]|uniref:hypothetical protein n=1 Tax=Pseudomonas TaxID=286 RepID=UPI0007621CB2|nr:MULTISPECIES: hypothetical protein [Pseudomonas]EKV1241292.1 hypothetical protein [Pseudomonas aeruginosa]EKV8586201.1 hypothetical protein [Pseudomonas aeruginosa]ELN5407419.1 hypothetical protein [Pseudomonas aeruginosa]ELP1438610.1 hypothetical protein [Pseudomonas aeruginosa]THB16433.1 hypothetical protein E6W26_28980 [Pseudomonas aeruginosa]
MADRYFAVQSTTRNLNFLVKKCSASIEFFKAAVSGHHYLFNEKLINVKTTMIRDGKPEEVEFRQVETERLKGLVKRVGLGNNVNEDIDDLVLFYFPEQHTFVFKELMGEISHTFNPFSHLAC